MYILGITGFLLDASAALLHNGVVVSAAEEERFSRKKHAGHGVFPVKAVQYVLENAGITIEDVDHVAFFFAPTIDFHKRLFFLLKNLPYTLTFVGGYKDSWINLVNAEKNFANMFASGSSRIKYQFHYIKHHLAHAASAFNFTNMKEAAFLIMDAAGEWATTTLGYASENQLEIIKEIPYPNSLGYFYMAITTYLGFRVRSGEGKIMGLSSYGKADDYIEAFREIVKIDKNANVEMDMSYFDFHKNAAHITNDKQWVSEKFIKRFGKPRPMGAPLNERYVNISSALQLRLEEIALELADYLSKKTKSKNLVMAGGVVMNSVMNGRLLKESKFKNFFFQPASNDAGAAIGAASYVYHNLLGYPRNFRIKHVYWGPDFSDEEIEIILKKSNLKYEKVNDISKLGAELLDKEHIIAWFQGRMEFGPRALGNRSILANPKKAEMKDVLNARVKHREPFRPFAPAILLSKVHDYFEEATESPFMLRVFNVKEEKKDIIPAVVHVDGTGRVQTVTRDVNGKYWELINEFYKRTDVPVILNTSFNIKGEPIICKPEEAIVCFLNNDIDDLLIGNFWVQKSLNNSLILD